MTRRGTGERKQDIIKAVLHLIGELGIQGVTMARIAEQVGLTEAALYRHFHGKLDIVGATIDTAFDELVEVLELSEAGGDAFERLRSALLAHLEFIERQPGMARILFSDEVHFNSERLKQKLVERGKQVGSRIATIIRDGKAAGTFKADLDVQSTVMLYRGIVHAHVMLRTTGMYKDVGSFRQGVWELFRRAIEA